MKKYSKYLIKAIILGLIFVIVLNLILSQKYISVTRYEYKNPRITEDFRVVHLTDLHNYQFGTKNRRLVEKVREETPDLIFLTGDMLNEDETRTDICIDLVGKLVKIAPVYVSLGNHEIEYMNRVGNNNLISEIEQAGAVVLNEQYIDMEINGVPARLGGVYGYVLAPDETKNSEQVFMEEFQDTDRFKILLSHVPEGLLLWKSMEYWDVDLVFSGHVHGGQVRLPFVGGLYDPEEGYFPTYTKGMFKCGNGTMILSAGLGSSRGRLRINNFPEMVVCEIGK
ncbi:putative metallophosphoesterase [uncultured Blautia sp.]